MDKKDKNVINTYAIIPEYTLSSDKKRQLIIANKINSELFSKLRIVEFNKRKFENIFITDKINFITLIKIFFINKKKIISYNLELNSLSYQALSEYFINDIRSSKSIKYIINVFKLYIFDLIKIFFLRLNFFFTDTICFVPSEHRIFFLKEKLKINCRFICIKNLPVESDLYYKKVDLNIVFSKNIIEIINDKNFFFINGNINNYDDFVKILKYCNKKNICVLVSTNQNSYLNKIDNTLKKNIVNIGYLNDKFLMYYIISKCLAGLCLYDNKNINQIYSSSTKFYDFLIYNKPIIYSNNFGIKKEVEFASQYLIDYNKFCNVDDLNESYNISNKDNFLINKRLIFENFYNKLKI